MLLLNEFVMYLIKFVALALIAVAAIILGVKHKKNKLAKEAAAKTAEDAANKEI